MEHRIFDWVVGFILGILSSLFAEFLLLYCNSHTLLSKAIRLIMHREGLNRLKKLRDKSTPNSTDPHAIVRADWAYTLYDLGSDNPETILKALNSLFFMADLLDMDERDVASEALRLKISTNQSRSLDAVYLKTMQRLQI